MLSSLYKINIRQNNIASCIPLWCPAYLQDKLANLRDFESNLAAAADQQKSSYDAHSSLPTFNIGDHVWLSAPTAGKLDSRWKGNWTLKSIKSPVNVEITDDRQSRVVNINCVQWRVQAAPQELQNIDMSSNPQNTSTK